VEHHPTAGDWSSNVGSEDEKAVNREPNAVTPLSKRLWSLALLKCKGIKAPTTETGSTGQSGWGGTRANHDENHNKNAFDNLRLLHGHCHDIVHHSRYLSIRIN
jgi:hypothetical protein